MSPRREPSEPPSTKRSRWWRRARADGDGDGRRDGEHAHATEASASADEQERIILDALSDLRDMDVREVMTPRVDVTYLTIPVHAEDIAQAVRTTGHSCFPVVHDDLDDLIGILFVNDIFRTGGSGASRRDRVGIDPLPELERQRQHRQVLQRQFLRARDRDRIAADLHRELRCPDHGGANALSRNRRAGEPGLLPRLDWTALIVVDRRLLWRDADAADDDHRLPVHLDKQRHFAAEPEMVLLRDGGGEHARDSGIDRVASLLEDPISGLDLQAVPRADHLARAADGRKHCARVLRERG